MGTISCSTPVLMLRNDAQRLTTPPLPATAMDAATR